MGGAHKLPLPGLQSFFLRLLPCEAGLPVSSRSPALCLECGHGLASVPPAWHPGRKPIHTSSLWAGRSPALDAAVTWRSPLCLCLGFLHGMEWPQRAELEDVKLLWGPVKCLCSCLRDVCDCRWGCVLVGRRGPALEPACPHGARVGRTFSVTYLPVSSAPVKGQK